MVTRKAFDVNVKFNRKALTYFVGFYVLVAPCVLHTAKVVVKTALVKVSGPSLTKNLQPD